MSVMSQKGVKIKENGRFFEFFFDQDVYSKIDELLKKGQYDSEKDVIVQAIKNLYERTLYKKTSPNSSDETLTVDQIEHHLGKGLYKGVYEAWRKNREQTNSLNPEYFLQKIIQNSKKFSNKFNVPDLTEEEIQNDVTQKIIDEERLTERQLHGSASIGLIWLMFTRLLPVKIALICLSILIQNNENNWIEIDEFRKKFISMIDGIVYQLENNKLSFVNGNELDYAIRAREIFSDAFSNVPVSWSENEIYTSQIKKIEYYEKKMQKLSHQIIGKLIKKKKNMEFNIKQEQHYLTGSLIEFDLIKAKTIKKTRWWFLGSGKKYSTIKNTTYVTFSDKGLEFVKLKNTFWQLLMKENLEKTQPKIYAKELMNSAFSKDEISFYLDKILPKFEFEHHFVDELIKKKRFEKSYQIQELFEERYRNIDWTKYSNNLPFNKSALALYEWAPIAEELKTLDRKIVLNSMILKWDNIKEEFQKLINF